MENKKDYTDADFDAYILGTMTDSERADFSARLTEDEPLQQRFALHERMVAEVREEARAQLRQDLDKIHNKKDRSTPTDVPKETSSAKRVSLRQRMGWAIAAGILLLIGFWFLQPEALTNKQLLAQYYEPYPLKIGLRDNGGEEMLLMIDDRYADKNYAEATTLLTEYIKDHPSENSLRLALAMSLFETKQTEQALNQLDIIDRSNDPLLMDQINWYKALMLIEQGEIGQAKAELTPLAQNPEADHHQEAIELLEKIK